MFSDFMDRAKFLMSGSIGRLSMLSAALRNQESWPKDFRWNYLRPSSCAIGLTESRFLFVKGISDDQAPVMAADGMGRIMGITTGEADTLFLNLHRKIGLQERDEVTPEHVAQEIDSLIHKKEMENV